MRSKFSKILTLVVLSAIMLCGCSGEKEIRDSYSLRDIFSDQAYGIYVKDGDTFYPLDQTEANTEGGFVWKVGGLKCHEVTKDTPLVAVYDSNSDMPTSFTIDKYQFLTYTIGGNVSLGQDGASMWFNTANVCEGSELATTFEGSDFEGDIELDTVNGEKYLSNIDTEVNILTGLEKNKYYDISIFSGTRNMNATICADTAVYKLRGSTDLGNAIDKTYDKYFIINLPENIRPGYYNINGLGFFKVKK